MSTAMKTSATDRHSSGCFNRVSSLITSTQRWRLAISVSSVHFETTVLASDNCHFDIDNN